MIKLEMDRKIAYVKATCMSYKKTEKQCGGGRPPKKSSVRQRNLEKPTGRPMRMDYGRIGIHLRENCLTEDCSRLDENGPFGETAISLGMKNSKQNRKHLQLIWKRNRGNVRDGPDVFQNAIEYKKDEDNLQSKRATRRERNRRVLSNRTSAINSIDIEPSQQVTENFSVNFKRRTSVSYSKTPKKSLKIDKLCICNTDRNNIDNGFMVECEKCKCLYHLSCLNFPPLKNKLSSKNLRFHCDIDECCGNKLCLRVKGKIIYPLQKTGSSRPELSESSTNMNQNRGRQNKIDYEKIGRELRRCCEKANTTNISEEGPFGKASMSLGMKNSLRNRKNLYAMWKYNRGSIRDQLKAKKTLRKPTFIQPKKTKAAQPQRKHHSSRQLSEKNNSESKPQVSNKSVDDYCICQKDWNLVDQGFMIECEKCKCWYHLTCLNFPLFEKKPRNKDISFQCCFNNCAEDELSLKVKGIEIEKCRKDELSISEKPTDTVKIDILEHTTPIQPDKNQENACEITETIEDVKTDVSDHDEVSLSEHDGQHEHPTYSQETESVGVLADVSKSVICDVAQAEDQEETNKKLPECNTDSSEAILPNNLKSFLDRETLSHIIGSEVPSEYFTFHLPSRVQLALTLENWKFLLRLRKGRYLRRGKWQHVFVQKLKEVNPHCVFMFDHHHMNNPFKKSMMSSAVFYAKAHCKFEHCPVIVELFLNKELTLDVLFDGSVNHNIYEQQQRPIRGKCRTELMKQLSGGIKPLKHYLECLNEKNSKELVSGNMDNLGKDSHLFAQIACESRQTGRESKNLLESLIIQMKKMKENDKIGFIQKVCAKPQYILYWSEEGLRLYHALAEKTVLFWDATGSVVRRSDDLKQFLYYELALKHPVKGKIGIPVSSMLSENQSLPTVQDWLSNFRHAEKKLFGYNKTVQPMLIISDEALIFPLAALHEFNNESLSQFVQRAWDIINNKDLSKCAGKTLVQLCASHFMHKVKKFCKQNVPKRAHKFCMYSISLLMNSNSLDEAQEILQDLCVTLQSSHITEKNKEYIERLIQKINDFETDKKSNINIKDDSDVELDFDPVNPSYYTEEDYLNISENSPFCLWGKKCFKTAANIISQKNKNETSSEINEFYCQRFLQYVFKRLIPMIPLWSGILLKVIQRIDIEREFLSSTPESLPRTTSTIENRFRILKVISLSGRTQHRLDDFSHILEKETVAIQKLAATDCLKTKKLTTKKHRKVSETVKERWEKKKSQPLSLKNKKGTYQRSPKLKLEVPGKIVSSVSNTDKQKLQKSCTPEVEVSSKTPSSTTITEHKVHETTLDMNFDVHTEAVLPPANTHRATDQLSPKIKLPIQRESVTSHSVGDYEIYPSREAMCPMKNFGATCWFNAMTQALAVASLSKIAVDHFDFKSDVISIDEGSQNIKTDKASCEVVSIWKYMHDSANHGKDVPVKILRAAVTSVVEAIPGFDLKIQQDAQDYNAAILSDIAMVCEEDFRVEENHTCSLCGRKSQNETSNGNTLLLALEDKKSPLTVQHLIDNHFKTEEYDYKCESLNKPTTIKVEKVITSLPRTLILVLKRFSFSVLTSSRKNVRPVELDATISLDNFCASDKLNEYKLASVVCHHGQSLHHGHYTCAIFGDSQIIECNDLKINEIDAKGMVKTAYILIYERKGPSLPTYTRPVLSCLSTVNGFKSATSDKRIKNHQIKEKLEVVSKGNTEKFEQMFKLFAMSKTTDNISFEDMPCDNFLQCVLHILFYGSKMNLGPLLSVENFEIVSMHVTECHDCSFFLIEQANHSVVTVKEFCIDSVANALQALNTESSKECICKKSAKKIFVTSLPNSLIVCIENCRDLLLESIFELEFSNKIILGVPMDCTKYSISSALVVIDDNYIRCKRKNDDLVACSENGTPLEPLQKIDVRTCRTLVIFYNKQAGFFLLSLKERAIKANLKNTKSLVSVTDSKFVEKIIETFKTRTVGDVQIDKAMLLSIINSSSWLNATQLNTYLDLFKKHASLKVHVVDCGWYSQRLIKKCNPQFIAWTFHQTEMKKDAWIEFDFIIVPIHENNNHWTLIVMDNREKIIYYSDSLRNGPNSFYVTYQIWRYFCFDTVVHTGKNISEEMWKICIYSDAPEFPVQSDGSSCGVFLCATAKAIITNKKLSSDFKSVSYRHTMVNEIMQGKLEL